MEGKARVPAPHTVPGPKSPLCPKIETYHIPGVLPGEGRQLYPTEALCALAVRLMLAPL